MAHPTVKGRHQVPPGVWARGRGVLLVGLASVSLLFAACITPEAIHLICTREAQTLLMAHGQGYSDALIQAEMAKRYDACMKRYTTPPPPSTN